MVPFSFVLQPGESPEQAFARLLRVFAWEAHRLRNDSGKDLPEAIHQLRLLIKRFRALLWFVRPSIPKLVEARAKDTLRKASLLLAAQRDAMVMRKTLEEVMRKSPDRVLQQEAFSGDPAFRDRKKLSRLQRAAAKKFLRALQQVRQSGVRTDAPWPSPSERLEQAFRAAKKAGEKALRKKKDNAFHDWRKKTKRLFYVLELTQPAPKGRLARMMEQTDKLQKKLGDYHDCVVTGTYLRKRKKTFPRSFTRESLHLLEKRKHHLRKKVRKLARSVKSP